MKLHLPFHCDVGCILDDKELLRRLGCETSVPPRTGPRTNKVFRLSDEQWATHMAVIGPTGLGKSRLLRQLLREHRRQRRGFCLIDVGDLARDFLADCAAEIFKNGNYALLRKLHYVKLGFGPTARYDAFQFRMLDDIPVHLHKGAKLCWQHSRVQSIIRVAQANTTGSTEFLHQPRAHRVLTNTFMALSVDVERRRLSIEDVFIFFDPGHKHHRQVVDRVVPLLPSEIRRELEMLGGFRRLQDLRQEVESSVNRMRMVLGPCLKNMLSATGTESCLDMKQIVEEGGYLVIDAQRTPFAGDDENVALASLMALDYVEEHLTRPKHKRRSSTLFCDETPELLAPLGKEIGRWLRILRKYGTAVCLAFQDLHSMRRDDFDLAPTVLSQCGTIVCFRSRWPDDRELLARTLLSGNLRFTPLIHEVERHPGHQFLQIDELSETIKRDVGRSGSTSVAEGRGTNQTQSISASTTQGDGSTRTQQTVRDRHLAILSHAQADSASRNKSTATAHANASGSFQNVTTSNSQTESQTEGWAMTVGHKIVPLPVVVRESQKTGQLEESIPDQEAKHQALLHGLERRQAVVIAPGMTKAIVIESMQVDDPFVNADAQEYAVERLVTMLHQTHAYYFQPTFDEADQEARVDAFLGNMKESCVLQPSDEQGTEHLQDTTLSPVNGRRRKGSVRAYETEKNPLD